MRRRQRLPAAALALLAGVVVLAIAKGVFPHHSINHDEGVYLRQAAMLLEGRLFLRPPVPESFRPWFFVRVDAPGTALYPKYAPVPAATFAVGKLLGGSRLALAGVAAGNVALTYAVAAELFDRRTGLAAGALLLASPLFLVDSALFLPYAPTMLWNLAFAYCYLRADRTGSTKTAALAGVAAGVAFFSRPYTAVLFAAPFVAHALWTLRRDRHAVRPRHAVLPRHAATAACGLLGVAAALGYNAVVTGSPLLFPYEAFAPLDGLGFGHREILGYGVDYTPELALRANARVVTALFDEWVVAGPLGTALAAGGVAALTRRNEWTARRAALAGLFLSVVAGNVYFWGNLNILGSLADPGDGLIAHYGPYYHFDLLVPTAVLAAHGARSLAETVRRSVRDRLAPGHARPVLLAALVVSAAAFTGVAAASAADPLAENAAVSDRLAAGYEPFEGTAFENALVFLPTPYGDWLGHPFQSLRNDPGFDGDAVYAVEENEFAVVDAFPNRTLYRYGYRGAWSPTAGPPVDARLQRVRMASGDRVVLATRFGVPAGAERVSIRVESDEDHAYYAAADPGSTLDARLVLRGDETARLRGEVEAQGNGTFAVGRRAEVRIVAFVDYGDGTGFSYRIRVPVERADGTVRALTPGLEVCRDPRLCGGAATYVPGATRPGVSMDVRFVDGLGEDGKA